MTHDTLQFEISRNSSQPLYLQFKEQLQRYIYTSEMAPGTKLPDIYTLSQLSGLSIKTVHAGLNELIRENICVRRPKKGTFVAAPQTTAPRARMCLVYHGHTMNVVMKDGVRFGLLTGVQDGCRENGIDLLTFSGVPAKTIERYAADRSVEIVGVIIIDVINFEKLNRLAQLFPNLRFFFFNDMTEEFAYSSRNVYGVFHDDFSGGYLVGRHVMRYELNSLGVVGMNVGADPYRRRVQGFMQAVEEHSRGNDCQVHEYWGQGMPSGFEALRRHGSEAARHFSRMQIKPRLFFIVNDVVAAGFQEYWQKHNPDSECHIFGYDNVMPRISLQHNFSTVDIDYTRMGRCVADLIVKARQIPKFIFTPPQLICRCDLPLKQ